MDRFHIYNISSASLAMCTLRNVQELSLGTKNLIFIGYSWSSRQRPDSMYRNIHCIVNCLCLRMTGSIYISLHAAGREGLGERDQNKGNYEWTISLPNCQQMK